MAVNPTQVGPDHSQRKRNSNEGYSHCDRAVVQWLGKGKGQQINLFVKMFSLLWGPPGLSLNRYFRVFPMTEPLPSTKIKNKWSHTSIPLYDFVACIGNTSFTFITSVKVWYTYKLTMVSSFGCLLQTSILPKH